MSNEWIEERYEEYLIGRVLLHDGPGAMEIEKDPRGEDLYKCQMVKGGRAYALLQWKIRENPMFFVGVYLPKDDKPCKAYEVKVDLSVDKAHSVKDVKEVESLSDYFEKVFRHQLCEAA